MNYDVVIIGAGPGGIFSAYELTRLRPEKKFADIEELRRAVCADIEQAERMKIWENGRN